ncbi:MAG: SdrD B-like domain-containing protein [Verrucomicrobiota bacterium]
MKLFYAALLLFAFFALSPEAFAQNNTVSGVVFIDTDGDGEPDPGEPIEAGATVQLFDSNGNLVATTTSGADGSYTFTNIPSGTFSLSFTYSSGVSVSSQPFSVQEGQFVTFDAPVVAADDSDNFISFVNPPVISNTNPGTTRSEEGSPFAP